MVQNDQSEIIMTFPEEEHESIRGFLRDKGFCYTTRVFKEVDKYEVGKKYNTNFGSIVEILEVKRFKKLIDHLYYDDLTEEQRKQIAEYSEAIGKEYEVIKFKEVCKN